MHCTFRWYDASDPIPLDHIRQIPGVRGIVSALYDLPPGAVWPEDRLLDLRARAEAKGLEFRVVESIPLPESIKLGAPEAPRDTDAWIQSLRAVAQALGPSSDRLGQPNGQTQQATSQGQPRSQTQPVVVTYNFMPVFDWTRTELAKRLPDGSTTLAYDPAVVERMDPLEGELELPGWMARYTKPELKRLLDAYRDLSPSGLYENLVAFLRRAAPAAEELGLKLALHPDDPPWPLFGLPRAVTGAAALRRLFADVPSTANGLCLCTGSFGVLPENDLPAMAREFAGRVAFAHLRNIKITGPYAFEETAHWRAAGSIDLPAVVKNLREGGFDGPVRPDHGRMIWGESGRAGYGLYDRALGAAYIQGLLDA